MGINCLYLTPIFSSAANHRYHAYDYFEVDPLLGGNAALTELIDAVHQRGMKLVLDGVFNHCGRGFWAFHHVVENGADSPYRDWFHVHRWPLQPYPAEGEDCGYDCWWALPDLPKFNHGNPGVREYLLAVGRHWLERGIDGWRLDVPAEVPADFWVEFRQMVRSTNPDAWIVGEVWGDATAWLQGDHFDGVMNYRLGWSSICWAAGEMLRRDYRNPEYPLDPLDGQALLTIWTTTASSYRDVVNRAQMNLLDSHDVPRALHSLSNDLAALKLALLLLFLHPGAPCIYYGTEAALAGGPEPGPSGGPGPACREAYPWDIPWTADLRPFIQSLVELRLTYPVIRRKGFHWKVQGDDGLVGEVENLKMVINRSRINKIELGMPIQDVAGWKLGFFDASAVGPQSAVLVLRDSEVV
jgi:neopullulanase